MRVVLPISLFVDFLLRFCTAGCNLVFQSQLLISPLAIISASFPRFSSFFLTFFLSFAMFSSPVISPFSLPPD